MVLKLLKTRKIPPYELLHLVLFPHTFLTSRNKIQKPLEGTKKGIGTKDICLGLIYFTSLRNETTLTFPHLMGI